MKITPDAGVGAKDTSDTDMNKGDTSECGGHFYSGYDLRKMAK